MGRYISPDSCLYDSEGNPIGSHVEPDGVHYSLNVHNAHVHTTLVNRHFMRNNAATENPSVAIAAGDTVIQVADTTGFVVGGMLIILDASGESNEHHYEITAVVVNTSITVNRPIDNAYTTSATLQSVDMNMNDDGSGATITFEIGPPAGETWHINRVMISITDQTAMDDSLFGGIAALTNGVTLRENLDSGYNTITNWQDNQAMIEDMYDVTYSDKAPAGFYGLRGRFTFSKSDVVVRLVGDDNDTLQILVQDDLTGLDTFKMKAQGHKE